MAPADEAVLIVVTAEELRAVNRDEPSEWQWQPGSEQRALLFTPDLTDWTVQDLAVFDDRQIYGMHVFENRVVLVTADSDGYKVLESFRP